MPKRDTERLHEQVERDALDKETAALMDPSDSPDPPQVAEAIDPSGGPSEPPVEQRLRSGEGIERERAERAGQREIRLEPRPPLDPHQRATARGLVATPLFERLPAAALRRLIQAARLVRLRPGEVLFRQGDPADALYVVVSGGVVPIAEEQSRQRLGVLEPGDFLGEIALVTDQPRNATIEALVDSSLLAIDRAVISELFESEPWTLTLTLRFLRDRLVRRMLATHPLFRGLRPDEHGAWVEAFRLIEVREGAVLIEQGTPAPALFILLAGALQVVETLADHDKEIATLVPGEACGEMSLLERLPAVARVVASRRSWTLALARNDLAALTHAHPSVATRLGALAESRRSAR